MRKIVTHMNPDLDAAASIWLLRRWLAGWEDAAEAGFCWISNVYVRDLGRYRPWDRDMVGFFFTIIPALEILVVSSGTLLQIFPTGFALVSAQVDMLIPGGRQLIGAMSTFASITIHRPILMF